MSLSISFSKLQQHSNDLLVQMSNVNCHLEEEDEEKNKKQQRKKECTNQNIQCKISEASSQSDQNMGYCVRKQKHKKINKKHKTKNNEQRAQKKSEK